MNAGEDRKEKEQMDAGEVRKEKEQIKTGKSPKARGTDGCRRREDG